MFQTAAFQIEKLVNRIRITKHSYIEIDKGGLKIIVFSNAN